MKYWLAALLAFPLAAAAPAPLITGAVRDQYGDPIGGAIVSTEGGRAVTDDAGTFALHTHSSSSVLIRCMYCRTTRAAVALDGTVTAVVQRYQALTVPAPSDRDLAALPYAFAQSAFALRPFTLLNQSSGTLPGAQLSTYGASRFGGLLVADGIASYDVAGGITPWGTLPAFGVRAVQIRDQSDAFRYGDLAGGGSFFADTLSRTPIAGALLAGSEPALSATGQAANGTYGGWAFNGQDDERARAAASLRVPVGEDSLGLTALASQDESSPPGDGRLDSNESGVRAQYLHIRANTLYVDFTADRSGYSSGAFSYGTPSTEWSDVQAQTGVSTNGAVKAFTDAGVRVSSGFYQAGNIQAAGTITQDHVDAGAAWSPGRASLSAGIGGFSVAYRGVPVASKSFTAQIVSPSLSAAYRIGDGFSASVETAGAFRLPSLLELYSYPFSGTSLPIDRYGSNVESLAYTDSSRVRVELLAMNERVSNLDDGMVHTTGELLTWQIAPALSLRAWSMHVNDTSQPVEEVFRFSVAPVPVTTSSVWLTYDRPSGIRVDAIYVRDLIDYRPDAHFDASISGTLRGPLRWYAGTERRLGVRYVDVGVRISP